MTNWRTWVMIALALVGAAGWMRKPTVLTKTETREVVKYKVVEHLRTLPGATIHRDAEGNTTITGPVEIASLREGERQSRTDTTQTSPGARVIVGASVLLPSPSWQIDATYRIGRLLFLDVGAGIVVRFPLESVVPSGAGARVVVSL